MGFIRGAGEKTGSHHRGVMADTEIAKLEQQIFELTVEPNKLRILHTVGGRLPMPMGLIRQRCIRFPLLQNGIAWICIGK